MTANDNPTAAAGGTWKFDDARVVTRMGYGAMQLAGPGVFGPPADHDAAVAVLRRVVELGINHIDTSDYYGPYVVNELIREALHPYPENLVLVTKVGALRDDKGAWVTALEPDQLRKAVQDNIDRLGVSAIDLVNLRLPGFGAPEDSSVAKEFEVLAELREQGLIHHLGVSNATIGQLTEARSIAPVAEVQNAFNIVSRADAEMVDHCAAEGIAYVPFFPLGGAFQPNQLDHLGAVAARHDATPQQIALAWLLARSPSILLIAGTSSIGHLEQNVAAASIKLSDADLAELATLEN
ncbi:MAG TPA: oxidoreductase [Pseudonocardiaceae bacterium]|jgi:aryl-alcohol dehydrogenase-like predicted oxidoreductase|nr:oxidoreductase [Pseudonocardiaceae bacterium]